MLGLLRLLLLLIVTITIIIIVILEADHGFGRVLVVSTGLLLLALLTTPIVQYESESLAALLIICS